MYYRIFDYPLDYIGTIINGSSARKQNEETEDGTQILLTIGKILRQIRQTTVRFCQEEQSYY